MKKLEKLGKAPYYMRALLLLYLVKFLTKILFVEAPPLLSVTALIEKNGKLLFVDLSYMKGLGLPGGIVQKGETLEVALEREVLEETGLKVTKSKYLLSTKSSFRGIPTVSAIFSVETSGETKDSIEGELVWMEPEKAIDRLAYHDSKEALRNIYKGSKYPLVSSN